MALNYPELPWEDGQQAEIMPGMTFAYSTSLRKWVPISPRFDNSSLLQEAFGVTTVEELNSKFALVDSQINNLQNSLASTDSDLLLNGRIWKTTIRPSNPNNNDIWIDLNSPGSIYSYNDEFDTWVSAT